MTKVTIGVYKTYKNAGNLRFHRKKTKKHWRHYFIEVDEDDENDYSFGTEWVSALKAVVLKRKQLYKKTFVCTECAEVFPQYVKKNQNECNDCPNGCE